MRCSPSTGPRAQRSAFRRALGRDGRGVLAPEAAVDEAAAIAACRGGLAGYKVPKQVLFLPALPVNITGKVERARLRERFVGKP